MSVDLSTIKGVVIFYDPRANNGEGGWSFRIQNAKINIAKLVGYIIKVQGWLIYRKSSSLNASALVIDWDEAERELSYRVNDKLPVDDLIGALELFKAQLVDTKLAQIFAAQQKQQAIGQAALLGADGRPVLK